MKRKNNGRKLFVWMGIVAMLMTISVASAQPLVPQNDVIVDVTPDSQTGIPGDILRYNVSVTNNGTVPDIIVVDSITDVPAVWAVELKDAGTTQTLPYQTPLLASETSHLLTMDVHISAYATAGAAMTINIHSYANHSVTDSDAFECLVGNNAPVLSSGAVNPLTGNLSTIFTYSVNYNDADNHAPVSINVTINGTPYEMTVRAGQNGDYTNGEICECTITGATLGLGSHTFQFNASDGIDYATVDVGVHSGPVVIVFETDLPNVELISADITITRIGVFGLNLSEINETHKLAGVTPQSAYMVNSTGAGNFTLRFTDIPDANTITAYKINATNRWIPLDTITTTDTVTFTMEVGDPPVVFGAIPVVSRPSGGGDGTYPPGWFETLTPAAPAETTTSAPAEKPSITPAKTPAPAPAVSPTETPITKLPTKGIPGFESVYVIAGMLAALYLMLRRR